MDGGEVVNRCADSGRKTIVDRDSLLDDIRGAALNGILQGVMSYNSLSTTACTFVDTFTIVHELLNCADRCARHPIRFVTSLTLCPARRSAETPTRLSLCGAILKYTTITNFFLRCCNHRASGGLRELPEFWNYYY